MAGRWSGVQLVGHNLSQVVCGNIYFTTFGRAADSGDREAGIPSFYEDNTLP